jgi:hypothetical protein
LLGQPGASSQTGTSVTFDGVFDRVSVPALGIPSDELTISCWVRRDGPQDAFSGLVFTRDGSSTTGLNVGDHDELRYHWNDGQWWWDSGLVLPDGEWVFVALVVEPQRATLWMGQAGLLVSAVNEAGHGAEELDGTWRFMRDPGNTARTFGGGLDDVRIWRHALSAQDVAALHEATR